MKKTNITDLHEAVKKQPEHSQLKHAQSLLNEAYEVGKDYAYEKFKTAILNYKGRVCDDCQSTEFRDYNGKTLDACKYCGQFKEKEK